MKNFLLLLLLLNACCFTSYAQRTRVYKFVNAANVKMREFPKDNAAVFVVLHAPARVEVYDPPTDDYYKNKKAVLAKWVEVAYKQPALTPDGMSQSWGGWVLRKYLVSDSSAITATKNTNTATDNMSSLGRKPGVYSGSATVKKGSKSTSAGRGYHRGPRGGCFYYAPSGAKVYVDKSLCN